jgi:hypothetical protein
MLQVQLIPEQLFKWEKETLLLLTVLEEAGEFKAFQAPLRDPLSQWPITQVGKFSWRSLHRQGTDRKEHHANEHLCTTSQPTVSPLFSETNQTNQIKHCAV